MWVANSSLADVDTTYEVQAGDTLWSIAESRYGDPNHWTDIARANPHVEPERLSIGQVIALPEVEGKPQAFEKQESLTKEKIAATGRTPEPEPIKYWLDPTVVDTIHFDGSKWTYLPVPLFVEISKKRSALIPFNGEQIDPALFQELMPKDPRVKP